ncbi:MAG TPA: hypothetical protein HPP94_09460 [Desulfuromonadales bacterium]|nr:hypothetical protein [Desulfuromonadales bacterium]
MKRIFPAIRKMTIEETNQHNLQNPGLILEYINLMIPLSAGYSDAIQIYRTENSLLILITNRNLGYVGLDEIDCLDGDVISTVFLEDYQLKESVGKQWFHMKPETLIKRLLQYM